MQTEILECVEVVEALAEYCEFDQLPSAVRGHVQECLRCQAEVSAMRRLRRSMRELIDVPVVDDPTILHRVLFALDEADRHPGRRLVRATAVTIGGLAAAAGVIVVASRQIRSTRVAV